ncbi:MAG: hypothetical protein IJE03_05995 [Ruminiclostridium sp.]|nr:hypothetical protein [Ruminiclostridium sp.]
MSPFRKNILILLALVLLAVAIATWGSLGSASLIFCLILMGASLLYQHFLTNNEENDYDMEQ